jgi:4-hydroxy-3-methylbut-2-enyl diphosphate reductase
MDHGFPRAEAVHTAQESLMFALPPELRRDIKAASQA